MDVWLSQDDTSSDALLFRPHFKFLLESQISLTCAHDDFKMCCLLALEGAPYVIVTLSLRYPVHFQTLNVRVAVVASTSFFDPPFVSSGVLCPLVAPCDRAACSLGFIFENAVPMAIHT